MNERLYTPPHYANINDWTPLIFLAGPVQGAPDWQSKFADRIFEQRSDVAVASPRRTPEDQERFDADEQVRWEVNHRIRARGFGVTAIWFAAQDFTIDYPEGRSYAQTTRIELGETLGWLESRRNLRLSLGFDPEYAAKGGGSEGYIRKVLEIYNLPVHDSEEALLDDVIAKIPKY